MPPEYGAVYQERLAELRDAAPPMSWRKIRSVLQLEWEEPGGVALGRQEWEHFGRR